MKRVRPLSPSEVPPLDAEVVTLTDRDWRLALALEAQRVAGALAVAIEQGADVNALSGRLTAIAQGLRAATPEHERRGVVDALLLTGLRLATGADPALWTLLRPLLAEARALDVVVAYASRGGVEWVRKDIERLAARGAPVRVLVGNYLGGTPPDAAEDLLRLTRGSVQTRLETRPNVHFHPKVYRIVDAHGRVHLAIGSSNLSYAALTGDDHKREAIEWSVVLEDGVAHELIRSAEQRIDALWETHGRRLDQALLDAFRAEHPRQLPPADLLEDPPGECAPNDAQREALQALARVRAAGHRRALVVAATGLGKTWLAAFDSLAVVPRGAGRVLFIAHRIEILRQAQGVFDRVRGDGACGLVFQDARDLSARHVFASIFSLDPDTLRELGAFDYVIIDEAHHSAARTYRTLLTEIQAKFVLGLTATPDRLDGSSIYELFEGVVAYEKTLLDAIAARWLVPFHYFGVPDPVDYASLRPTRGRYGYDEQELSRAVRAPERQAAALRWLSDPRMAGARTLLFCIDIDHAQETAELLERQGQRVAVVHSGPTSHDRGAALELLTLGQLDAIVSVDMFNEGVDVPAVDRVVLLRPTESPTVFLQQIGRGLRSHAGKQHLTIVDLVGNHRRAQLHLQLLGVTEREVAATPAGAALARRTPDGREVWLAPEAIAALKAVSGATSSVARRIEQALELLDADGASPRPRLAEVLATTRLSLTTLRRQYGSWIGLLRAHQRATPADEALERQPVVRALLEAIEETDMSGPHKMFVLLALARSGRASATAEELAPHVRRLANDELPFVGQAVAGKARASDAEMRRNLKEMPFQYLAKDRPDCFAVDGDRLTLTVPPDVDLLPVFEAITERAEARLYEYKSRRAFGGELVAELAQQGDDKVILRFDRKARPRLTGSEAEDEAYVTLRFGERSVRARVAKIAINVVTDASDAGAANIATEFFCQVAGVSEARLAWRTWVRLWPAGEGVFAIERA